ncbi:protein YgfX [Shewanella youngdeokensis]|uniref:Protein YgfX n=1 Tax=Shewanella youngdeokensis TaxID=2999068 RepID=A0ABZ0JX55_9GAMM|nr:protein YgfX [Shewanella sp. DAU334]
MGVQQHSFSVTSSFGQRLSLAVLASVCLTSFCIWPSFDSSVYHSCRLLIFCCCLMFFIRVFWRLKYWRCQVLLSAEGHGVLNQQQRFIVTGKPIVTPFAVMFYVEYDGKVTRVVVWADMLNDTNYRHLCRLLLQSYQFQRKLI